MERIETTLIDFHLDVCDIATNMEGLSKVLEKVEKETNGIMNYMTRVFDNVLKSVEKTIVGVDMLIKTISPMAAWDISTVSSSLLEISSALSGIFSQLGEQTTQDLWTSLLSTTIEGIQIGAGLYSTEVTRDKGKFESGQGKIFGGITGAYTTDNNASENGITNGMFAGIGDFSSMLPDEAMLESLSTVITKLKEGAAAWVTQTGAKLADKAVDLQIIALYAADYVKAFGAMIAQIASSTAAWVKNTAAKAASTAAEWAQIAATTAWNALCAVATTVTTAFGAAMAFLTSPIGLVVAGITALIAVIVLLVKNWDTVKAAAVSVWATIQSAFGTAAAWFNEKVVQPVAGFFSGMWEDFRQAAVNAWEGVKCVSCFMEQRVSAL